MTVQKFNGKELSCLIDRERRNYTKKKLNSWLKWFNGNKKKAAELTKKAISAPSLVHGNSHYVEFNNWMGLVCVRWANLNS